MCVCVFDLCIYVAYCGHDVVVLVDIYAFLVTLVAKRRIAEISLLQFAVSVSLCVLS